MKRVIISFLALLFLNLSSLAIAQTNTLVLKVSDGTNETSLTVGADPSATDGVDAGLDVVAPPPPPAGSFDARIKGSTQDYFTEFKSDASYPVTFTIAYAPATDQGPITLTWDPTTLAAGGTYMFKDTFTGALFSADLADMNGTFTPSTSAGAAFLDEKVALEITFPASLQQAEAPTFDPVAGTYTDSVRVSLASTTTGATIHYTTDGSAPTTASAVYSAPILINTIGETTLNAITVADGFDPSEVSTATYTVQASNITHNVTFEVYTDLATNFNPDNDDLYLSGSFVGAGWDQPGSNQDVKLSQVGDNTKLYTTTLSLEPGEHFYKYFSVPKGTVTWDNGEWPGDPNRSFVVSGDTTLKDLYGVQPGTVLDIGTVRTLQAGAPARIRGLITTPDFGFDAAQFYMQDADGGLKVYVAGLGGGNTATPFAAGQQILLDGFTGLFNDETQLLASGYLVELTDQAIPDPIRLSTPDDWGVGSAYQGMRVTLPSVQLPVAAVWPEAKITSGSGVTTQVEGTTVEFSGTFDVRIDRDESFFDGTPRPSGVFDLTGVMGRFQTAAQVYPFYEGELVSVGGGGGGGDGGGSGTPPKTFTLTVGDGANSLGLTVGVDPSATDGEDAGLDVVAPPSPPAGSFDARIKGSTQDYLTEYKSDASYPVSYTIAYGAATGQGPITITWDPSTLAAGGTYTFKDTFTGTLFSADLADLNGTFTPSTSAGAAFLTEKVALEITFPAGGPEPGPIPNLFFSEFVSSTPATMAAEVFNATDSTIALTTAGARSYLLLVLDQPDGTKTWADATVVPFAAGASIAPYAVHTVRSDNADAALGAADLVSAAFTQSGDVALALAVDENGNGAHDAGEPIIDVVGDPDGGLSGSPLTDRTLVRKGSVATGSQSYAAAEWTNYANGTYAYFGDNGAYRVIAGNAGFRLLSMPMSSATAAELGDDTSIQGVAGGANIAYDPNLLLYTDTEHLVAPASMDQAIGSGYGFALYFFNNEQAGSQPLPLALDISGEEPTADVTVTLNTTQAFQSSSDAGLAAYFTLLGNPFQAPIDLASLTPGGGLAIQNNIHLWDPTTASYVAADRTAGLVVAPWQGFWVEQLTTDAAGTTQVTFPLAARSTGTATQDYFSKSSGDAPGEGSSDGAGPSDRADVSFTLHGPGTLDKALRLHLSPESTPGYDRADATKLVPLAPQFATLGFQGADGVQKSVESQPLDLDGPVELPLRLNTVGVSGPFELEWTGLETLPASMQLRLTDHQTGAVLELTEAGTYAFTHESAAKSTTPASTSTLRPSAIVQTDAFAATGAGESVSRFTLTLIPEGSAVSTQDPFGGASSALPAAFALQANYPNPFNPSTTLRYGLPEAAQVRIEVYTVLGQKVMTLLDGSRPAGWHTVRFDASGLPSGVYIARMSAPGGFSQNLRMLLVK